MSLKKKKKLNHNNPVSFPAYKCFECHTNTSVITQLVYVN